MSWPFWTSLYGGQKLSQQAVEQNNNCHDNDPERLYKLGEIVDLRLRELFPRGQRESGSGNHAT